MELHLRMIILFLVMVPSAAEEEKSELTGVQGGSVTFPDPVMELGFVIFGGKTIAMVNDRKFKIIEETYKDRLFWNDTTGLFTLRGLQRSDSGVYTIDSKTEKVFTHRHKLTVYDRRSLPLIDVRQETLLKQRHLILTLAVSAEDRRTKTSTVTKTLGPGSS
ncbi:uncharacterized protein LOC121508904 isoform X3 [Xyrichtys novacula]|uniref:Uncharacterized protein LOC121508904 isoform X3 n=1 Tax=Xyrichtys novacula TaxID=13765 RepID=A0AAV1EYL2_XYRNO|nr:uncharacterized protein LOC121508904 isoform X3 [Xyrichtys novacula]